MVLKTLQECLAANLAAGVEREAKVLSEGALAGAVETRNPHAHFVTTTAFEAGIEVVHEALVMTGEAVGDLVFRYFLPDQFFIIRRVVDDGDNLPVDRAFLVKEFTYSFHKGGLADVDRAVVAVFFVDAEKAQAVESAPGTGV